MNRRTTFALVLLVTALAFTGAAAAQEEHTTDLSKVERKNRAPVSKDLLKVTLPRATEATLSNGLTVLIMENHRLPMISMQLNISGAGPIFEPANMPGLANITAQMLRQGTKTRTSVQIAEQAALLGAEINAASGFGSSATVVDISGLSDNFDQWFALATDVLLNPNFPADELGRLKQRMKAQLRQQRANPNFLSTERFNRAVYGNHPASVVSATNESIDAITPAMLEKWHQERYVPQNAILGIAGDVKAAEIVPKLEKAFGGWKKTELQEVLPQNPKPAAAKKVFLVDRPNSVQTTVVLGNIAIDRRDPDYFALDVANHILGGGTTGRLFLNLREEKGYTYGVYSTFTALKYPGPWRAGGDVRTEVTSGAMTEFFKEFQRLRDEKVPAAELDEAKRSIVASFALSLENPAELLTDAIVRKIYGFPPDYWDAFPAKVMAVTADDIQRVTRKYLNPDNLQVVAVGDVSKIKPVMEKYGPVEVYDAEGKKVGN
ncbi:MAG TPA: pitrilysin family protein [Terriglobia bacterium]|nr:pitrilysin family protein [Terriglobia bacterium]